MFAERHIVGRVECGYGFYLVAPEHHSHHDFLVGEIDVDRIAFHSEGSAGEVNLVARVECFHQAAQKHVAGHSLAHAYVYHVAVEVFGVAHAVEARYRAHHYHILAAREKRRRSGKPQLVNLVVDHQVFFYIFVYRRYIGFGLVVIIVRHEILHGVLRKEILELPVELCRQCLVMAEDKRGFLHTLYHIGHGEGFSGAGHAQKRLRRCAVIYPLHKLCYGLRLVSGGFILRCYLKVHYPNLKSNIQSY